MRSVVAGVGFVLGSVAALAGVIATLFFAWGLWQGGTMRWTGWQFGPHHVLAVLGFLAGWELVGTICFFAVAAPFLGFAALFPEKKPA